MARFFLLAVIVATLVTVFAHSYFGEHRLIGPLASSNIGVISRVLAKQVLRFALFFVWAGQTL
ncbi:MAG: hypothetical protein ABFD89_17360 [Bryobacteraceae bacterium]